MRMPRRTARLIGLLVIGFSLLAPMPGALAGPVGFTFLEIEDPVSGMPVPVGVWYPATEDQGPMQFGPFTLNAGQNAPPEPGTRPLIVISHGNGGSTAGHLDTAQALAEAGMIAATPTHAGDNFQDTSLVGTSTLLESRPKTVSAVISALMTDDRFQVDAGRIGFFGFSMGGYTGLALMGARPAAAQFTAHCAEHPGDPVCRWDPNLKQGPMPIEGLADPRIAAAVIAGPMTAHFSDGALEALRGPILLMSGSEDRVIVDRFHTDRVAASSAVLDRWVLEGAGHFSFLTVFPDSMRDQIGPAGEDPPGFDRAAGHRDMNARIVTFFEETLR